MQLLNNIYHDIVKVNVAPFTVHSVHSANEQGELSHCVFHSNSTVNIVSGIIIFKTNSSLSNVKDMLASVTLTN